MKTYNELIEHLEVVKSKRTMFTDVKLYFNETAIFCGGLLKGKGNIRGCEDKDYKGTYFYISTEKGYLSAEWKKSKFYKMGRVELTKDLYNELLPFFQETSPKVFTRKTEISVASVIANHINSKVDYASNKMRQ